MSIDFGMDLCLQSDAHQSHMVDADWIVTEKQSLPLCKVNYFVYATRCAVFYFWALWCQRSGIQSPIIILIVLFLNVATFKTLIAF